MLRCPLHLLLSLHRFLLRNKIRHKSGLLLFRPISKTAWSTTLASKLPSLSTPILGHQSQQLIRMIQRQFPNTALPTRRLAIHRRYPNNSICIQCRTMISSGSQTTITTATTANNQVAAVFPSHFFTPRPPLLGVHTLPPPPPTAFRTYNGKPPWTLQQQQQQQRFTSFSSSSSSSSSSSHTEIDDVDGDDYVGSNTRFHRIKSTDTTTHRLSTYTQSVDNNSKDNNNNSNNNSSGNSKKQSVYRPPDIRGMMDLMEIDIANDSSHHSVKKSDTNNSGGNSHYHPAMVHRGQPPRKSSPQLKQTEANANKNVDLLKHDELFIQTSKNRHSSPSALDNPLLDISQEQWYIAIPMDLSSLLHQPSPSSSSPSTTTSSSSPSSSSSRSSRSSRSSTLSSASPRVSIEAADSLFFMEQAVSVLDPVWLTSFHLWGKLIREHLTKVMRLIQLVGMEAHQYYTKVERDRRYSSKSNAKSKHGRLDDDATAEEMNAFKVMMTNTCSELRIYLPSQLCSPLPTTNDNVHHWVYRLMKDPPSFEIKSRPRHSLTEVTTMTETTSMEGQVKEETSTTNDTMKQIEEEEEEDLVMVQMPEQHGDIHDDDESSWHIGPRYFQGIHSFLNHVDSMIESSPAFANSQRRFSA